MVTKKQTAQKETKGRMAINTVLLLVLTAALGVMTCCGVKKLNAPYETDKGYYNVPAICTEDEGWLVNEDSYLCWTDGSRAEGAEDYAFFLYDQVRFASVIQDQNLMTVLTVVGSMLTAASLVATIVYWNHNR